MSTVEKSEIWKETFTVQKKLTSHLKVKTVFDVGAYNGGMSLKYKEVFPDATIYSFEPFPASYKKALERTKDVENIHFFQKAISDQIGEVEFHCNKSELTNSLIPSSPTGTSIDDFTSPVDVSIVEAVTINDFCRSQGIDQIDILKLDIQGAELAALRGSSELLDNQKINLLFLEVEFIEMYKNQPLFHDISSYLYSKGYYLYDFRGMSYTEKGQVAWADAIFCSQEILNNLHVQEEKENVISGLTKTISELKKTVFKLENTTAWQKKAILSHKETVKEQSTAIGRLKGEREWYKRRNDEQEAENKEIRQGRKTIEQEKNDVLKTFNELRLQFNNLQQIYNELQVQFNNLQVQFNNLQQRFHLIVHDPIISKYIKLKKLLKRFKQSITCKKTSFIAGKRRVIVNVQYGLGNRLRALASAQLLAKKTGREFVLLWIPDIHCQAQFSDLFVNDLNVVNSLDKVNIDHADVYNYMDSEEGSEKNKFINHESTQDIYVKSAFVLNHKFANDEEINSLLQQLEPTQEIKNIVDQYELGDRIGLHIREGGGRKAHKDPWDNAENWSEKGKENLFYWRDKSTPQVFMKELDRLLELDPTLRFFLAADSEEIYSQFKEKYKDKIQYLNRDLYDRSVDQQKYALADILLLSRTKYILGSYWSSFSEIAQRFGGNEMKHSGKDF